MKHDRYLDLIPARIQRSINVVSQLCVVEKGYEPILMALLEAREKFCASIDASAITDPRALIAAQKNAKSKKRSAA